MYSDTFPFKLLWKYTSILFTFPKHDIERIHLYHPPLLANKLHPLSSPPFSVSLRWHDRRGAVQHVLRGRVPWGQRVCAPGRAMGACWPRRGRPEVPRAAGAPPPGSTLGAVKPLSVSATDASPAHPAAVLGLVSAVVRPHLLPLAHQVNRLSYDVQIFLR